MEELKEIENRFTYHKPTYIKGNRYEEIRKWGKEFAIFLTNECPESRELSLAITKLEEVVFWANAAIARREE